MHPARGVIVMQKFHNRKIRDPSLKLFCISCNGFRNSLYGIPTIHYMLLAVWCRNRCTLETGQALSGRCRRFQHLFSGWFRQFNIWFQYILSVTLMRGINVKKSQIPSQSKHWTLISAARYPRGSLAFLAAKIFSRHGRLGAGGIFLAPPPPPAGHMSPAVANM